MKADESFVNQLLAARERQGYGDFLGKVNAYCDNGPCAARSFEVDIKWYYGEEMPTAIHCPLCGGSKVIVNHVLTAAESDKSDEAKARRSVNVQRYRRQGVIAVPMAVYFDDSLPQ